MVQQWGNEIPGSWPILQLQLAAPWPELRLSVSVLFCSPHLLFLWTPSPVPLWAGGFLCLPVLCVSVLLGWCSETGEMRLWMERCLVGESSYHSTHPGLHVQLTRTMLLLGSLCITGGRDIRRSQCAGKQARSYRLLAAAAKDKDVNGCVTRSQQETKQALLCGLQKNHISNLWATQSLVFVWVLLFLALLNENLFLFLFSFLFSKKKYLQGSSILISVNINDYYSMIIAIILKTKNVLWCGCVWVFYYGTQKCIGRQLFFRTLL